MIELRNIKKEFVKADKERLLVIDDLSLHVKEGEFVCLVGQSGCGKSTTLSLICGLETCERGNVLVAGQEICGPGRSRKDPSLKLGFVFQQPRLLPWKTVTENAKYVLTDSDIPKERWDGLIEKNIELLGLKGFENSFPSQLSGGMQARAGILRAYVMEPTILLMDEPFSHLDEITAQRMRSDIIKIWQKQKMTTLFVTHDISEATFLADRIIVLTPRPAKVFSEYIVDLPHPRLYTDERRFDVERRILSDLGQN